MSEGFAAALWLAGFLAGLAALAIPLALAGLAGWWAWRGPLARAGLRVRAWRFMHRRNLS